MKCPNCHGEIDDNLITCSMCGYILNYDKLDVDKDLDKSSRILFLIKQNLLFVIKLAVLFLVAGFTLFITVMGLSDPNTSVDSKAFIAPILIAIVAIVLIIVVIKGKRKW